MNMVSFSTVSKVSEFSHSLPLEPTARFDDGSFHFQ